MNTLTNVWSQRKLAVVPLVFAMILSMSRALTIAFRYSADQNYSLPAWHHARVRRPPTIRTNHVAKLKLSKPSVEVSFVHMNSNVHEYNVIYAGHILCNGRPCQAELDLVSNTTRNENIHRITQTMEDGNFWVQVPLSETMPDHVDWKIMAHNADGRIGEAHGRSILSEDAVVAIDSTVSLK